jgi:hypothetical protein
MAIRSAVGLRDFRVGADHDVGERDRGSENRVLQHSEMFEGVTSPVVV